MKIAIVGAGVTSRYVKDTPANEIWTFNHVAMHAERGKYPFKPDLVIDIHDEEAIREPSLGKDIEDYWEWLQQPHDFPILMQEYDYRFPSSMMFPKDEVKAALPGRPMASSLDWTLGLAVVYGVKDIYLYGCTFGSETEYRYQVGGNHYWMGVLEGRGINIHVPEGDGFFFDQKDYGYNAWVRISMDTMLSDLDYLITAKVEGADAWRYQGAIQALNIMIDWGSVGRQALERLHGEIWNEIIGNIYLHRHGVEDAGYEVLWNEGKLCLLLHYMRICDLLPSTLEIKEIDQATQKPVGVV